MPKPWPNICCGRMMSACAPLPGRSQDPQGLAAAGQLAGGGKTPHRPQGGPLWGWEAGCHVPHRLSGGSDEEYTAAFKKAGIVRAAHIEEMFDLGLVLSDAIKPRGKRVAIVTITGGGGILAADRCEEVGLEVPLLDAETQAQLKKIVPPFGAVANPVDVTAELIASPGLLKETLKIIIASPSVDSIIIFLGMQERIGTSLAEDIAAMAKVAKAAGKPILVSWMAPPQGAVEVLRAARVPLIFDVVRTINALSHLLVKPEKEAERWPSTDPWGGKGPFAKKELRSLLLKLSGATDGEKERLTLTEAAGRNSLPAWACPFPGSQVARTAAEALKIASKNRLPPCGQGGFPDILHKSDAGAVRLNLQSAPDVERAFGEIMANSRSYAPDGQRRPAGEMVAGDPLRP